MTPPIILKNDANNPNYCHIQTGLNINVGHIFQFGLMFLIKKKIILSARQTNDLLGELDGGGGGSMSHVFVATLFPWPLSNIRSVHVKCHYEF